MGKLGDLANLVHLDTTRMDEIAPIFEAGNGALSWTDAAVVEHCRGEDAEPLCYDGDIEAVVRQERG